jgi:hypothetical protein
MSLIRDRCRPHGEGFVASAALLARDPILRDLADQFIDAIQSNFISVWTKADGLRDNRMGDRACFKHALHLNATSAQPFQMSFRQEDPTGSRVHETFHITMSHKPGVQHVFRWDPSSGKVVIADGGLYFMPVPQSVADGFIANGTALRQSFTDHLTSKTSKFKCNACSNCGAVGQGVKNMQKCGRCEAVRYCGRACQIAHLTVHKKMCDWIDARKHTA